MKNNVENREHKSDVFSMLLEYPEYALNVYNVLNGTNYTDSNLVEIKTLEKGISLSIRNDAAFIIGSELNIYEHQSTYCKNMPLRSLIYYTEIIKSYIKDKDVYGRKLVEIPTPHFVVFYNGADKRPEVEVQSLSDSYRHDENIPLELKCTVYNINPNNNDSLKNESYVLKGYTIFVEKVKELIEQEDENAISNAIEYCIENDILKDFFESRKDEVRKNMTIDMTFEAREKIIRRDEFAAGRAEGIAAGRAEGIAEGRAEGIAEGRAEGLEDALRKIVQINIDKGRTLEEIAEITGESIETIKKIAGQ